MFVRSMRPCSAAVPAGVREPRVACLAHDAGTKPARQALRGARRQQFVPYLYPPARRSPPPRGQARVVRRQGRWPVHHRSGQFDTQTVTIRGYGKPMTSNISRKLHFQFVIAEPTDPTQAISGTINLTGGNYLQNSTDWILHVLGPTSSEVNGLPTNLHLVTDANSPSSTAFAETGGPFRGHELSGELLHCGRKPAPPPGSPGSLGPPTSVATGAWRLERDLHVRSVQASDSGTLGSGTVIVQLSACATSPGAQSQFDQQYN